jgi:hypothetical protein
MTDAQDDATVAARALAAKRWGSAAVVRSAQVVIDRADELPEQVREQVHQATDARGREG